MLTDRLITLVAHAVTRGDQAAPSVPAAMLTEMDSIALQLRALPGPDHQDLRRTAARLSATVLSLRSASPRAPLHTRHQLRSLRDLAVRAARLERTGGLVIPPPPAAAYRRAMTSHAGA